MGDYMLLGPKARLSGRLALMFAALSTCLLPSAGVAQTSSSAQNHVDFDSIVQDQYPNQGGYNGRGYHSHHDNSWADHLALEVGAGFNVPSGNTTTWQGVGYSINVGGGWMFTNRVGVLAEYGFNHANIPVTTLTNIGEPQGNVHLWSLTLDPIIYLKTSGHIGSYVTGGGGFYRKLTSFTEPVYVGDYCSYFYGCYPQYDNVTLSHFSSNQGGVNIGAGVTFKPNTEGRGKFFAEARYVWVNSPPTGTIIVGTGTVNDFPVTFGFRW